MITTPTFPELDDLLEAVRQVGLTKRLADLEALSPYMEAALRNRALPAAAINAELHAMLTDARYAPSARDSSVQINARDEGRVMRVILTHLDAANTGLPPLAISDPAHSLIGSFNEPLLLSEFDQKAVDASILIPNAGLHELPRRSLDRGSACLMPAGLGIRLISSGQPTWTLSIFQEPCLPFIWQYDMTTKCPVRSISAETATTRIELSLRLLAELGDAPDEAVLASLFGHSAHHVRWQAAATLVRLDETRGLAAIEALTTDVHPQVRAAAGRTLENFRSACALGAGDV